MNNNKRISEDKLAAYGKVAVLMGGTSAERSISLKTGIAVLDALCRSGINAISLDAQDKNILHQLSQSELDRVFIALHGRGGEDGTIQGALEIMGLSYTGSGVLGSSLTMDKTRSKWIWEGHGLNTPVSVEVTDRKNLKNAARKIGFPLAIKPVHEGSSCGAFKVTSEKELSKAYTAASQLDERVMLEKWINGREYTASILNGEVLPLIRLETPRQFYDYEAKYTEDSTKYICPCGLSEEDERLIGEKALLAYRLVNASGWARVDLILDSENILWFIELNTIPGMTSHSLVPMAAKQAGIDFDDLVLRILDSSLEKSMLHKGSAHEYTSFVWGT